DGQPAAIGTEGQAGWRTGYFPQPVADLAGGRVHEEGHTDTADGQRFAIRAEAQQMNQLGREQRRGVRPACACVPDLEGWPGQTGTDVSGQQVAIWTENRARDSATHGHA